ncbi:glycosyltransferase family 4 protein [Roseateles sp. BYS87W]|uniref:Glycosyltransferase family 4 protein n=1 Tax=Pelomonas baiyunensis TaxID=3299026 RepID=A0ABW7H3H7_9BURK
MKNTAKPPVRVMMLGLRAIVGAQGGVESHVRDLARGLLQSHAAEVALEVVERARYVDASRELGVFEGRVRLKALWCPASTGLETIVHTALGVLYAAWRRPDVLHIHAVGPSLLTPLARLLGLRVVVTHHGEDYAREKWGRFARWALETGEAWGARFANAGIVIAAPLQGLIQRKYGRRYEFIPNAAPEAAKRDERQAVLARWGLQAGQYFLHVGRVVPEKRQLDLIAAFAQCPGADLRLVLAGANDHPSEYENQVNAAAALDARVVRTGALPPADIYQLLSHARAFVLPSSHEGLPISLLEAMRCGAPVRVSDIVSLKAVELPPDCYVPCGDVPALAKALQALPAPGAAVDWSGWLHRYALPAICQATVDVYRRVARRGAAAPVGEMR